MLIRYVTDPSLANHLCVTKVIQRVSLVSLSPIKQKEKRL